MLYKFNLQYNVKHFFVYDRYDTDDCEVDESEGEDDEVNGNEDGDGDANEEDSEEGMVKIGNQTTGCSTLNTNTPAFVLFANV